MNEPPSAAQAAVFENYRIESKNENQIPFIVNIGNLIRSIKVRDALCSCASACKLQSDEHASKMIVKLTKKKERACLTFEISTGKLITLFVCKLLMPPSFRVDSMSVIQDIPIVIQTAEKLNVRPALWSPAHCPCSLRQEYLEPELADPKVKIRMPNLKALKNVVDRMKSVRVARGLQLQSLLVADCYLLSAVCWSLRLGCRLCSSLGR